MSFVYFYISHILISVTEVQKPLQRSYSNERGGEMDDIETMAYTSPSSASNVPKSFRFLSSVSNISSIEAPEMEKKRRHTGTMIFCIDCL